MADYRIRKRADVCMATGRAFEPGETIVSAIYDAPEGGFERRDMCEQAFAEAQAPFSFWRSRHPEPAGEGHRLDYDLALQFFDRLVREADPEREGLVYVLTLLLSRKRRLKVRATKDLPDGELLTVVRPGPEDDETVQVRAPRLDAGETERLQADLARLFNFAAPDDGGRTESTEDRGASK